MAERLNRQWLLKSRPAGAVSPENFTYVEGTAPDLADGEALVRCLYFGFDASQRAWMNEYETYVPPIPLGAPMRSMVVGRVTASRSPDYAEGDLVHGMLSWSDYAVIRPDDWYKPNKLPDLGVSPSWHLGVLGIGGLTAYFGIKAVAQLKPGATVLVSAATGASGSLVGAIAKECGAGMVIGLAGGAEKTRWLAQTPGYDAAIDYKLGRVNDQVLALAPKGVDCFFDGVGGDILDDAIKMMRKFGVIVVSGAMSTGYGATLPAGPRNFLDIVSRSLRVQGFVVTDYADRFEEAVRDLLTWIRQGKISVAEEVAEGFMSLPAQLPRVFAGKNPGKLVLKNDVDGF